MADMTNTGPALMTLAVEAGALTQAPIYEGHKRGRNWCAIITTDPKAPGGLGRDFLENGRGRFFYLVEGLEVGAAVEFGADYYSCGGRRYSKRWYGAVVSITPDMVTLEKADTGAAAIRRAAAIRAEHAATADTPAVDRGASLGAAMTDALLAELARRGVAVCTSIREAV